MVRARYSRKVLTYLYIYIYKRGDKPDHGYWYRVGRTKEIVQKLFWVGLDKCWGDAIKAE